MTLKFNKQQLEAINFYKGACAVIAGAGSGKSTVLLNRVKTLVRDYGEDQEDILAISFTRNTANELKKKLHKQKLTSVNVGTFHSVCRNILLKEGIEINEKNTIKEWQRENCFKSLEEKPDIKDITGFISYQKNFLRGYTDEFLIKESKYTEEQLRLFYKEYEAFKSKNGLYDYDDYLLECYKVLKNNKHKYTYEFILVDEHQDSNLVQNLILKELCASGNIFCLFDYRQAIYTFRGGNTEYCMEFEKDWENATVINLDTNYRSNKNIVDNANSFIKEYYGDYEHYADSVPNIHNNGDIQTLTYQDREAEGLNTADKIETLLKAGEKPSEICVLYRLNSHSSYVENELKRREIEYDITNNGSFFKRKEVKGIVAYLRLIRDPHDDAAFRDIFTLRNDPFRYFSNKNLKDVESFAGQTNMSLYEAMLNMRFDRPTQNDNVLKFQSMINKLQMQVLKGIAVEELIDNVVKTFRMNDYIEEKYLDEDEITDRKESLNTMKKFVKNNNLEQFINFVYGSKPSKKKNENAVRLMSIHASKGLEFKHVFLIGVEDGKFPHRKSDLLDEARLFYVGVTRPKESLYLSQIGHCNMFFDEYRQHELVC
ncbi:MULTISPECIES: ATP-dependent helicase [Bacillus amyloliquefaciens group]|uniref:ATP-dependent helicase n=1 Tax=Bacillus amyloliquefaciens group TaxID=1938374 RepID=UPI0002059741|nr:ATP-dependent helicase [Bacillus amyloliquefaciens]AIW34109.1 DNA helicase UvrD [Bacillus subtilis]AEB23433.1 ATP-dependent DNA helicase, uvrD-like protein [Bacillus amyloliquefaciens TA208]AEK88440.1 UvrD/REP helicase [Bacillus amyloliquefaciens XH7]MEC0967105.1 ATP-dependent helicase [Bacillus amyloliquefaciens]MEC1832818.1 ATP-dependent helicase [Bacillus amyloliquefaciens]